MRYRFTVVAAALALFGACGNISNEDLEFAAILPDENLLLAMPASPNGNAVTLPPESSPSFEAAVATAAAFNQTATGITQRLRKIVMHPATVRRPGHREWGPFTVTGYPGFLRLIMDVDASVTCELSAQQIDAGAKGFRWRVEAASEKQGTYGTLISGLARGGDFTQSCGMVEFDAAKNRQVGGTETDLEPRTTHLAWYRTPAASQIVASVTSAPVTESPLVAGKTYAFTTNPAGGQFAFTRRFLPPNRPGLSLLLNATLSWGPNGTPWKAAFSETDEHGNVISHGESCGHEFGEPSFERHDLPPGEDVDDDDDDNCSYDYSRSGMDPDHDADDLR